MKGDGGTRRTEDAQERTMLELLERLHEGVISVDSSLCVEFANGTARRFLSPAALSYGSRLPEPWESFSLRGLADALFGPRPPTGEHLVTTGSDRTLAVIGIPNRGSGTAMLVLADVSQRVERERIEQEFVANAAHQLRTPLAAIAASVEVLQAGAKEVPGDRDRFLGHIEREAARLGRLARTLLLLARLEAGQEVPRLEVLHLAPLLEDVAAGARPPPEVALEVDCPRELVALANADLLEEAVSNLIANAVTHTVSGRITLRALDEGSGTVALEIVDSGPGMGEEELGRVFDRFYRGSGAAGGFGLGLPIARQAARASGGDLTIESAPGAGTTARLTLRSGKLVT